MSWPRALLEGAVTVAAGFVLLFVVPNALLTQLDGLSRSQRVTGATTWFFASLVLLAWALRRLQSRHVI